MDSESQTSSKSTPSGRAAGYVPDPTKDLAFLREVKHRIEDGRERRDPEQIEYALEMLGHWIDELKEVTGT